MLNSIVPKLPMRNKAITKDFYTTQLGFTLVTDIDYPDYLMLQKEEIEVHFFTFENLNPKENYGQVYIRVTNIKALYQQLLTTTNCIHPDGHLVTKPWGQNEFSLLDPDNNLLTFGESID